MNNIKTTYNRVTFLVALLVANVGLLGIVSAFFLNDYKVIQACILAVSAVWIIACEFVAIREVMTYEEIDGDMVYAHRVFKPKQITIQNLSKVVVSDRLIYLIDYAGRKFCVMDSTKPNTNKFVDALVEKGLPKEFSR